jgi:hypothetical protein
MRPFVIMRARARLRVVAGMSLQSVTNNLKFEFVFSVSFWGTLLGWCLVRTESASIHIGCLSMH